MALVLRDMSEELNDILKPISSSYDDLTGLRGSFLDSWDETTNPIRQTLNRQLSEISVSDRYTTRLTKRLEKMTSESTPSELTKELERILKGQTGVRKLDLHMGKNNINTIYHQQVLPRVNELAQDVVGFENEAEFRNFIDTAQPSSPKLLQVFNKMREWVKEHPSPIVKGILAVGFGAAFLKKLREVQDENTGCFVYTKRTRSDKPLKRDKIVTRSCQQQHWTQRRNPEHHPLNDISWTCAFNTEKLKPWDRWGILDAGCKAICDPYNYNLLVNHVSGYHAINSNLLDDSLHYRCETSTFLHSLAVEAGDVVYEVATGLADSLLGINFPPLKTVIICLVSFIVCVLFVVGLVHIGTKWLNHSITSSSSSTFSS